MEDMDKTIEVVKAAMEKEKQANQAEQSMDKKIDNFTDNKDNINNETQNDTVNEEFEEQNEALKEQASSKLDEESSEDEKNDKSEEEKEQKSGISFFKSSKNKELETKLEAKEQKIQELTDKLLRTMAEFDNYRKRTEKEKSQMFSLGVKSVIEKLLPVVDNFERGLSAITEENKDNALAQGYNMIYKQLMTMLDDIGVKPIEAVGKPFDPNFHNAIMHNEDETLGENIVAEEFQKGYMYNDMVVRYSMVRVVN